MNSIKRYRIEAECDVVLFNDDGVSVFGDIITDYKNNSWCKYSDVEQLQARIKELESAERTLISLGYENKGGETWKPPIRKRPNFNLIDSLNERIKELESDAHINEIKAQGISEAIKGFRTFAISNNVNLTCGDFDEYLCEQVNKLRAKDEKEI